MNPPYDSIGEVAPKKNGKAREMPPDPSEDDYPQPSFEPYVDLMTPRDPRQVPEADVWDSVIPPPEPTEQMFYGILGELAKQAGSGTEVNPVAAMASAMTWLSACMGRNRVIHVGDGWHHLRLFTLHVGRSYKGGKGMAKDLLMRVVAEIEASDPDLAPKSHTGGLSSREGLVIMIHDGFKEGKTETPPIHDKRLFIIESEFSNILAQAKREGNTLSSALRDAWDGNSLKPATKSSRIWASRPHIAIHGSITPTELRDKMSAGEMTNGFANRFMVFWAERRGLNAFPDRTPDSVVDSYAGKFKSIIRFGLAGYPNDGAQRYITLDTQARAYFKTIYAQYAVAHPGGEMISGLLQRRAPMALRIAGLFAMADMHERINLEHLTAAAAWMDYYAKSVHMVFGPQTNQEQEVQRTQDAQKLLDYLRSADDWKSRTEIAAECFQKHINKEKLDKALEGLMLEKHMERREVDTGGIRPKVEYRTIHPDAE
jgi:hypothetical protein